jgi:uncharacterized protein YjbJ (UPF0337 family)
MNWERIEGNWKQFKGTAKARWGRLTDHGLDAIAGRREQLSGHVQEAYGITRETAERQIAQWQRDQRDEQSVEENQRENARHPKEVQ